MTVLTTLLISPPSPDLGAALQDALKSHTTALLVFGILFLAVGTAAMLWTLGLLFGIDLIFYGWALIAIRSAVQDGGLALTIPR